MNYNKNKEAVEDGQIEIEGAHLNIDIINTQTIIESSSRINVDNCAAVGYCSGWMAIKAKNYVFKNCKSCKSYFISESNEDFHNFIKKKNTEVKDGCGIPPGRCLNFWSKLKT